MGRPPAMTAEERKKAIFAAAEQLFGEAGYEKVTMADIAAAAGMSKKTLYVQFTDKEELLQSLISSSFVWPDDEPDVTGTNAVERLRARLELVAEYVLSERHINLCRLAISERKGVAEKFLAVGIEKGRSTLTRFVVAIPPEDKRVQVEPEVLAGMLFGATVGHELTGSLLTGQHPDRAKVSKTIAHLMETLFRT